MHEITARAPAKVNLALDIVGSAAGGYHEVSTIYQAVDLEDELHFALSHSYQTSITIVSKRQSVDTSFPVDSSNIIVRAAELFLQTLPERPRVEMKVCVEKNIPVAAGLAGGSGNAAATLLALNYFFGLPLARIELLVLASKLGADVPFCLEGGTCVGRGVGDDLKQLKSIAKRSFLLVKPQELSIATSWAYNAFDEFAGPAVHPDIESAVESLQSGNLESLSGFLGNAFEPVVFAHYPELAVLRQKLLDLGALSCHITGKGPTLCALMPDRLTACAVGDKLTGEIDSGARSQGVVAEEPQSADLSSRSGIDCFVVESVPYGARLTGESRSAHQPKDLSPAVPEFCQLKGDMNADWQEKE